MARNVVRMTEYFYEAEYDWGDKYINFFDTKDELFYALARIYAFDDLYSGKKITAIVCEGWSCYYAGYQPDMVIEFVNIEGKVVWSDQFPEWDH